MLCFLFRRRMLLLSVFVMAPPSSTQSLPSPTVLTRLLDETLSAFPSDANHEILQFFVSAPPSSSSSSSLRSSAAAIEHSHVINRELNTFSEVWSKSLLISHAFGARRGEADSATPGPTFVENFISEISKTGKDVAKLGELSQKLSKSDAAVNAVAAGSRASMLSLGAELLLAAEDVFVEAGTSDPALPGFGSDDDYALMLARHAFKGAKKTWAARKAAASTSADFVPLSRVLVPFSEIVHGFMDLKPPSTHQQTLYAPGSSSAKAAAAAPSSLPIVGVKVSATQPHAQLQGWGVYGFLSAASVVVSARSRSPVNMFPSPVAVDRIASGDLMFVFESHNVSPLLPRLGPAFARSLRRHPPVVVAWCRQFAAAIAACSVSGVGMACPLQLGDLFVREHGLLTLLHVAVTRDADEESSSGSGSGCKAEMVAFAAHVLTSMLALSRRHDVVLRHGHEALGRAEHSAGGSAPVEEQVVTITQGCTIDIAFRGAFSGHKKVVLSDSADAADADGAVQVDAVFEKDTAAVSVGPNGSVLRLRAMAPGHVVVCASMADVYPVAQALTAPGATQQQSKQQQQRQRSRSPQKGARSRSPSGKDGKRVAAGAGGPAPLTLRKATATCVLRVIVVPAEPSRSLPVIELITLLEASRAANKPLFLNARCMQPQRLAEPFSEDDELIVYKEWSALKADMMKEDDRHSTITRR